MKSKTIFVAFCCLTLCLHLRAQQEFTIQKPVNEIGNTKPIPISLNGFSGEAASVLRLDLEVQGFKVVEDEQLQFQLSGSNNGNVQGRLIDAINKANLIAKAYTGGTTRAQAH